MRNEGPFSVEEIEALSTEISPETKRPYGVQRVCLAWDQARSSFYVRKQRRDEPDAEPPQKPGPKTALSDEALLVKIQEDLAASPFKGEGHRKVWARLRVIQGILASPKRVVGGDEEAPEFGGENRLTGGGEKRLSVVTGAFRSAELRTLAAA